MRWESTQAYVQTVVDGMEMRLTADEIHGFLLRPLREHLAMKVQDLPLTMVHHLRPWDRETAVQRGIRHFYDHILQIALHLGEDDRRVEALGTAPQMSRILARLTVIAARDGVDDDISSPWG